MLAEHGLIGAQVQRLGIGEHAVEIETMARMSAISDPLAGLIAPRRFSRGGIGHRRLD